MCCVSVKLLDFFGKLFSKGAALPVFSQEASSDVTVLALDFAKALPHPLVQQHGPVQFQGLESPEREVAAGPSDSDLVDRTASDQARENYRCKRRCVGENTQQRLTWYAGHHTTTELAAHASTDRPSAWLSN